MLVFSLAKPSMASTIPLIAQPVSRLETKISVTRSHKSQSSNALRSGRVAPAASAGVNQSSDIPRRAWISAKFDISPERITNKK